MPVSALFPDEEWHRARIRGYVYRCLRAGCWERARAVLRELPDEEIKTVLRGLMLEPAENNWYGFWLWKSRD